MADPAPELAGILGSARLLALDVDGTLTDGSVVWIGDRQAMRFSIHDGQGLAWLRRAGVVIAWISGRDTEAARARAEELQVDEVHLGVRDKTGVLTAIQARLGIPPEDTLAMGDDLPDLGLAARAALFAAPADARPEVRARAQLVTEARAGRGAVRELCEHVLAARGDFPPPGVAP